MSSGHEILILMFLEMRMVDPVPTFSYLVHKLRENFPDLAYIHTVEPRVYGNIDAKASDIGEGDSIDVFRKIWGNKPLITAGGFRAPEEIAESVRSKGGLVAIGRYFISNVSAKCSMKNVIIDIL